jgi:hypothetical protein
VNLNDLEPGCETKDPTGRQFLSSFSVTTCMQPAGHKRMIHWILFLMKEPSFYVSGEPFFYYAQQLLI